jgi:4-hydroxy-2-oxoheptanedioate aldolase
VRPNRVKQRWREGQPVRATWLLSGDPFLAEVLTYSGVDAIVIDMQHGPGIGSDRAVACLQAINITGTVPFVRIPWNDPVHFQYVLDAGAYGVIVPLVNTPEDAARAAGSCRYPPIGFRSAGPNRVSLGEGGDYLARANDEIACLVMIETITAVENIEAIAQVPGIDGFFIGPGDLALSLGLAADAGGTDARHRDACRRVVEVAQAHGLVAGIATSGPEDARRRVEDGYTFCPFGTDWGFVAQGIKAALATFEGN